MNAPLIDRIRAKLPTIRARTGNLLFDSGTDDACNKIETILVEYDAQQSAEQVAENDLNACTVAVAKLMRRGYMYDGKRWNSPSPTPEDGQAAVPFGRANIKRFRGDDGMMNCDFELFASPPDGSYALYTAPPACEVREATIIEAKAVYDRFVEEYCGARREHPQAMAAALKSAGFVKKLGAL